VNTIQTAILAVGVWFLSNWSWNALMGDGSGGAGGAGGDSAAGDGGDGTGGAGGAGTGGAGGAGASADYAALAAAVQALADGVTLPNIKTAVKAVSAGTTELVPYESGKRITVLAYAITASGTMSATFKSGSSALWRMDLSAAAGNSGANLSTAWPGYLFACDGSTSLSVTTDSAAIVCVTYWME
jgi:hypothetical protein